MENNEIRAAINRLKCGNTAHSCKADYIKLVGRSKATLSRWIKAINLIIEKGYFTDFASGVYDTLPIYIFYPNKETA